MGQNPVQKNENCPIGAAKINSMGQNGEENAKNCLIERRYGTKCRARKRKLSHRRGQIGFYETKEQEKSEKQSHRTTLWDKMQGKRVKTVP